MPKARPDQVIVHRLELQSTERDALEAALAGRFVTNGIGALGTLARGIGAALTPFSGAITALATLWIADRTIDEIKESVQQMKKTAELLHTSAKEANSIYEQTVAWLDANYANNGYKSLPDHPNIPAGPIREHWLSHVEFCSTEYGPFDASMLLKMVAKAVTNSKKGKGTPSECFVREVSLDEWQAWQTQYNARRR